LNSQSKYIILLTLLYFILSYIGIRHHELWLDEAHHWLLARDSYSLGELLQNTRNDGHPVMWNVLLYGITWFTSNPLWMQLLHITISTAVVFLFLKCAPFSWPFKILFIFGYFMFFEYNLISRNYILGIFFLFAACAVFKDRKDKFVLLSLFLALAANVHLMFSVVAFALFLTVLLEHFQKKQLFSRSPYIAGYAIFTLGILLLAYQINTPQTKWFFESISGIPPDEKYTKGFISLFKGWMTIPDFSTIHFWNSNLLVNLSKPFAALVGLFLYVVPLMLFFRKRKVLFFVYTALIGTQIFFYITQRGATRFDGITFFILIIALWIEPYFEARDFRLFNPTFLALSKNPIVYSILLIQFGSGVYAYAMDYQNSFTGSKEAATFLKEQHLENAETVTVTCDGTAVSPYLEKKMYFLCDGGYESYCHWNFNCAMNISQQHIIELLDDFMQHRTYAVYVSNYPIASPMPNSWIQINDNLKIRFLKKFDNDIIRNSQYYIYEISRL
jgi:hypothetical protein